MSTDSLFEPIRIGSLEIANRIVMGPMALADSFPPGLASAQTRAMLAERAAGGVGLIVMGGVVATRAAWESAPFVNVLRLDTDDALAGLSEVVEAVHAHGTKIFAQLMQGYGQSGSSRTRGVASAAASAIGLVLPHGLPGVPGMGARLESEVPREIGIDEIERIEREVGQAAARARRAGFDGVELPSIVGYLANSFFSPRLNRRTDRYGGSFDNRVRFIVNNVRQARAQAGADFPVGVRLTVDDHQPGGITLDDALRLAKLLQDDGIAYLSIFEGSYETLHLAASQRDGEVLERGAPQALRRALTIPILCPGVHAPENAARMIAEGQADMVVLTRPLLADPHWARKARQGRAAEIVACDRGNGCLTRLFQNLPVRCTRNPQMGWERLQPARAPMISAG